MYDAVRYTPTTQQKNNMTNIVGPGSRYGLKGGIPNQILTVGLSTSGDFCLYYIPMHNLFGINHSNMQKITTQ